MALPPSFFCFLFGRHCDFARRCKRCDLCRRRFTSPFGNLAPQLLFLAPLLLLFGTFTRFLGSLAASLFLLSLEARFFLGAAARLFDSALRLLAAAVCFGDFRAATRLLIRFFRVLQRAYPARPLFRG